MIDRDELIAALKETEEAHHKYETEVLKGVRDKDWADWYTIYLKRHWNIFDMYSEAEVTELLTDTAKEEGYDWVELTARYIIKYDLETYEKV